MLDDLKMPIAQLKEDMSQKEIDDEIERACDEIIAINPLNIYKKVYKEQLFYIGQ